MILAIPIIYVMDGVYGYINSKANFEFFVFFENVHSYTEKIDVLLMYSRRSQHSVDFWRIMSSLCTINLKLDIHHNNLVEKLRASAYFV